ncbi:MAG TPA: 2OG-Fe(II) oxygenase [Candidatus Baltobacteraceae bacterium]|nr:2OG-Fe(II) oxygenase [Candidatus Baltobacteraceae bacterium]
MIDPAVLATARALHERFERAAPFRHVVIDGFFIPSFARRLLEQFPPPRVENEQPGIGRKVFRPDLPALGEAYAAADAFFRSSAFLDWTGLVTGIDGLLYDPTNYGGGTHENFYGRDLKPHVDFNYHPVTKLHRRVNLIVYLNESWRREWGGAISLYADPREDAGPAAEYDPAFNRCIIFETSERSWHGFDRIDLPPQERHRTRKSLSIYLYTLERPEAEIATEHTTFFVPRALADRYAAGYRLTADDERELRESMQARDNLIQLYQSELAKRESDTALAARLRIRCAQLESAQGVPVMGYVRASDAGGKYSDGWAGGELRFRVYAEREVRALTLRLRIPDGVQGTRIRIEVDGREWAAPLVSPGYAEVTGSGTIEAGASVHVRITSSETANPKRLGLGPDERDLGFFLECAIFEHRQG